MADKKIIAVLGATGSQGGGLVRAILADPNGGFAARAMTRDVNSDKAKELAKLGAEVVAGRRRRRGEPQEGVCRRLWRVLRHVLLEAFLAGEGDRQRHQHGRGGQGRRRQARHLVDARRHAQVGAAERQSHAHAAGQIQGVRTSTPRARPTSMFTKLGLPVTFLHDHVLLGQRHLLRHGPAKGSRRQATRSRFRWATRKWPALPRGISASAPTASSRTAASGSARPWASPAST